MRSASKGYFTLIGSLPHLPAPDRAERLPINRQRLLPRFAMLDERETRDLALAGDLLFWERSAAFESDAEVNRRTTWSLREISHPGLRRFVEYWMELRTVLAALRRQARGMGATSEGETWGVGPRALWIERNWDQPDYRLGAVHPWIGEARELLAAGRAEELQRLETDLLWKYLSRVAEPDPFSFDAVYAYRFKWYLLDRWLARDPEAATERFRHLVEEVSHELEQDVN